MESRKPQLTIEQIEANFHQCMKAALGNGEMPTAEQGFYPEVSAAISVVALDYPGRIPEHVLDARKKWEKQRRGDYDREMDEMMG